MAEWQSVQLKQQGLIKDIGEAARHNIEQLEFALDTVRDGAEFIKSTILGFTDPAGAALLALANALIASLQNFKEAGMYVLVVDPLNGDFGLKNRDAIGFEMERDAEGRVLFKASKVLNPATAFLGTTYEVNDEYRKSINLVDLSNTYRDVNGKTKSQSGFIPPIPRISPTLNLVPGGYNPETWTGTKPSLPQADYGVLGYSLPLPVFPAPKCKEIMAAAFEDEGDVPRHRLKNVFERGPYYTYSGDVYPIQDRYGFVNQELYKLKPKDKNGNTLSRDDRFPLTNKISSGKPNYQGNTDLSRISPDLQGGITITAVAVIAASSNPNEWIESLKKILNLFSGFEEFKKQIEDYGRKIAEQFVPTETVRVRASNKYSGGLFQVGDLVIGKNSRCIGKIKEVKSSKVADMKIVEYTHNVLSSNLEAAIMPTSIVRNVIDKNKDGEFYDMELEIFNYTENARHGVSVFTIDEVLEEAEEYTIQNPDGEEEVHYRPKYMEQRLRQESGIGPQISIPDSQKPKYGTVVNIFPTIPPSVLPDFYSFQFGDHIPGYKEFFDNLINLAEVLKSFAESSIAAIQIIIDAIDDIVEYFEEIVENIIEFLELFDIGLPNLGVWYMGMRSQNGSQAFANAIRNADGGPGDNLKISAGFCFVGDPVFSGVTKDAVEVVFGDILGLEFQSVS